MTARRHHSGPMLKRCLIATGLSEMGNSATGEARHPRAVSVHRPETMKPSEKKQQPEPKFPPAEPMMERTGGARSVA